MGKPLVSASVSFFIFLLSLQTLAQTDPSRVFVSPDGKLRAAIIKVKESGEDHLRVLAEDGKVVLDVDYSSPDGEHGRAIIRAAWTADSQFFVYSTESTGGHQPWARPTYFYTRLKNKVYSLDKYLGPIVQQQFTLRPPDVVETEVLAAPSNVEGKGKRVRVRLSRLNPQLVP